jgi:broad specificity phosphatase PhoE
MLIIDTVPGKTPVRHFVFARHGDKDKDGNLTPEGHDQARSVGVLLANLHLGAFGRAIHSPVDRTRDTAKGILEILDPKGHLPLVANSALFDSEHVHKPELVKARVALYKTLGESSLAEFRQTDEATAAMDELGTHIRTSIQHDMWCKDISGNFLVVGHGVYLNQGLVSLFGHKMTEKMFDEVLRGDCLSVASGYLIGVDEKLVPTDMHRFSWADANLK